MYLLSSNVYLKKKWLAFCKACSLNKRLVHEETVLLHRWGDETLRFVVVVVVFLMKTYNSYITNTTYISYSSYLVQTMLTLLTKLAAIIIGASYYNLFLTYNNYTF